jgi:hypothetical protein
MILQSLTPKFIIDHESPERNRPRKPVAIQGFVHQRRRLQIQVWIIC